MQTMEERNCDNCGFGLTFGEDSFCLAGDAWNAIGKPDQIYPATEHGKVWCSDWQPCSESTRTFQADWLNNRREKLINSHWQCIVGPIDELHL